MRGVIRSDHDRLSRESKVLGKFLKVLGDRVLGDALDLFDLDPIGDFL